MNKNDNYIIRFINLIYEKHLEPAPFLDVFRKDIRTIKFLELDDDETATINLNDGKFEILFNILFIRNYFLTDEDILWIICHEISHFILNHFNPHLNKKYSKDFRNLAFDCQVNSLLYNINERNEILLFKKLNGINHYQYLNGEDSDSYVFLTIPPFKDVQTVKDDFEKIQLDKEKADLIIEFLV